MKARMTTKTTAGVMAEMKSSTGRILALPPRPMPSSVRTPFSNSAHRARLRPSRGPVYRW